ncbi:MAG TPA: ATP-binding protein [Candidatus Acidoferrales bacterium]|nr:ATP-binding protein [Candidatus Acidoferrales bacterium]
MNTIPYVNEIHSKKEWIYRPRWIASELRAAIKDHSVVVLTGARQVGKSTLLQREKPLSGWRYITLDDFDAQRQAEQGPPALWAGVDQIVIDEVQKSPRLLSEVKRIVDRKRPGVSFVLSGSANLLLMRQVSESLSGRAVYFTLYPMTYGETEQQGPPDWLRRFLKGEMPREGSVEAPPSDPFPLVARGFMPSVLALSGQEAVVRWWEGYVATYLERDLRQISQIESLVDFRKLMEALALRNGQILNQTEVGRDIGLSQPTVHRYLNILEATCLLERLPAFARSRTKRLMKTPKIYWIDPGLAAYLAGYYDEDSLRGAREVGGFFASLVILHLKVLAQLLTPRPRFSYWRTLAGKEVDLVIEHGRRLLAVEIKLSPTPSYRDTEALRLFLEDHPETTAALIIHTGREVRRLHEKIVAIPWHFLSGKWK